MTQKTASRSRGRTPQPAAKASRRNLLIIVVVIGFLLVGAFLVSNTGQQQVPVTPFTARTINAPIGFTPEGFAYKGKPDAPVTVVEYGDFQCPACGAFATQIEPALDKRYVETGKVRFIYHDFPLPMHKNAVIAAAAARAAGEQGKYWEMHDLLFTRQRAWSESGNILPILSSYAEAIGLDRVAFDQALKSQKFDAALKAAQDSGVNRGVNSTPTFEVNGRLVDGSQLEAAIESFLTK